MTPIHQSLTVISTLVLALLGSTLAQVDTSELTITSQETDYPAYLAAPSSEGAKPAVVLMHSINGLEEGYLTLSDQLAAEGFVVLTLGWQEYEREPTLDVLDQLLRDSVAYLRSRDDVAPEQIGLTGFCIGGFHTMYFLPTIEDFASGVAWYGFPTRGDEGNRPIDEAILSQLDAPMLIIHGTADQASPIAGIYDYANALDQAGKFFELNVYQGEPHSFLVDGTLQDTFAADDAYAQMVSFFERTLSAANTGE